MGNLIIKGKGGAGNKLILQDQAGGAVLTTADSGATMASNVTGIPAAGVTGVLPAAVTGGSGLTALGTVTEGNLSNTAIVYPAGHVRQVLYDQQTASDSNTVVTSATYVPIVGLSQAITILASSKVYIHTNIHLYIQQHTANNWSTANLKIFRDSTEVHLPAGTNPYVHGSYVTDASSRTMTFVPLSYLDTPGSAGTYTYTVKISSKNGFGVGSTPTDQMGFSNITLMEITG